MRRSSAFEVVSGEQAEASVDEISLVSDYRMGCERAAAELWRRHYPRLVKFARVLTDRYDPEDLASETFALMFRAVRAGKGPTGRVGPYLRVTLRNLSTAWTARELPIDAGADLDLLCVEVDAFDAILAEIDDSPAKAAFRALRPRWQQVIWLSEFESLSRKEISVRLGIESNAVGVLMWRALQGLRREHERVLAERLQQQLQAAS